MRLVKTPFILSRLFPKYVWKIPNKEKAVFLTFDDGPHPEITLKVLALLKQYHAKATFFCVGQNAEKHTQIIKQIIEEGHAVGNHTYNHLNGYKTPAKTYLDNVEKCAAVFPSKLFRPPYGKLTRKQGKALLNKGYSIIMWDVLSYDFDKTISPEKCTSNVIDNLKEGSVVVLHDSEKAEKNMLACLEATLNYCQKNQFICKAIKF